MDNISIIYGLFMEENRISEAFDFFNRVLELDPDGALGKLKSQLSEFDVEIIAKYGILAGRLGKKLVVNHLFPSK
jgi:hypothetical protein